MALPDPESRRPGLWRTDHRRRRWERGSGPVRLPRHLRTLAQGRLWPAGTARQFPHGLPRKSGAGRRLGRVCARPDQGQRGRTVGSGRSGGSGQATGRRHGRQGPGRHPGPSGKELGAPSPSHRGQTHRSLGVSRDSSRLVCTHVGASRYNRGRVPTCVPGISSQHGY